MIIELNSFIKELYKQNNEKDILIINGINYFLEYYKQNKRKSTYFFYKAKLTLINDYFKENEIKFFSQINEQIIMNYISTQKEKNNKNVTINKNVGTLKTLISFLTKRDMINPINLKIEKLKETKPNINILETKEIKQILEYIKKFDNQKQLIFYLLATTGIRRTELINIKRCNIDMINNKIFLEHTKSGHTRNIFLTEETKKLLINEIQKNKKSLYLFTEKNGKQLSVYKIDHFFTKVKKDLKIEKLSPHILRHTYATQIIESNDIETVRLLLGHESYEMTKRYLHIKNKKLMDASINCNPLAYIK